MSGKRGFNIIPDGYTRLFFIRGVDGLHGPLSGRYRPMLVEHRDRIYSSISRSGKAAEYNQMIRAALATHVTSWDAVDPDEKTMDVTEDNIRHLQPTLYDKLYGIVCGDRPSDLSEDASEDEVTAFAAEMQRASAAGKTVGAANEEADRKN